MTIAAKLQELEALLAKATPRPWRFTLNHDVHWIEAGESGAKQYPAGDVSVDDAALIVFLVNEAPDLIRSLASRLEDALSELDEMIIDTQVYTDLGMVRARAIERRSALEQKP